MNRVEPLSPEELVEMQTIQLKKFFLSEEDQAFARKLAEAHGLDLAGYGKTWNVQGFVVVHLTDEITGQELTAARRVNEAVAGAGSELRLAPPLSE